jgi:hypothetical protein
MHKKSAWIIAILFLLILCTGIASHGLLSYRNNILRPISSARSDELSIAAEDGKNPLIDPQPADTVSAELMLHNLIFQYGWPRPYAKEKEQAIRSLLDNAGIRVLAELHTILEQYALLIEPAQDEIFKFYIGFARIYPDILRSYPDEQSRTAAFRKKISDLRSEIQKAKDNPHLSADGLILRNLYAWFRRIRKPQAPALISDLSWLGRYSIIVPQGQNAFLGYRIEPLKEKEAFPNAWLTWMKAAALPFYEMRTSHAHRFVFDEKNSIPLV